MILSVQGLSFRYPSRAILHDINFSVSKGDCLAVLGTNGAGKSTLLQCINRILKPQTGVIHIQNDEIFKLSPKQLAKKIGYVTQKHESNRFTVFDAVLLGRKPHIKWDISAKDKQITNQILELLNLKDYSLRYLDELSGGELQKVIIARALAQEPSLLLLDEPTSNLDLKNQMEVISIITETIQKQQIAAIVTMHDLNLSLRLANKFILLKQGTIFAAGGIEIMTPENVETIYSVPVSIEKYQDIPVVVPL